MQAFKELDEKNLQFSENARAELNVFTQAINDIMELSIGAFQNNDMKMAKKVEPLEQVIDYLNQEEKQRHIIRLRQGRCTIELGFILTDISTNLERVSDHCSNIALCLLQSDEGGYDAHEFLDVLKNEENEEFKAACKEMDEKYRLPENPAFKNIAR